jgi:hypothetical protein
MTRAEFVGLIIIITAGNMVILSAAFGWYSKVSHQLREIRSLLETK